MSVLFIIGGLVVLLIVGLIFAFDKIMENNRKRLLTSNVVHDGITKKYEDVDIHKSYAGPIFSIGLAISLGIVLTAFEWKTYDEGKVTSLGSLQDVAEEVMEIPPTEQKPPPPPKIIAPEIVEVPDEEDIKQDLEVDLSVEVNQNTVVQKQEVVKVEAPPVKEEEVEEIFTIVEEGAEPIGGMEAFLKYVSKNLKYPAQARRMGVEGKVFVQFVVDRDGSITDVKVVKGIGAGCDEEAVRVIENAPKWKPGKQRGRPVKQRIVLPISFKLG
ncbi:energy transducer TonB [Rhodoflexus sp.]